MPEMTDADKQALAAARVLKEYCKAQDDCCNCKMEKLCGAYWKYPPTHWWCVVPDDGEVQA